MHSYRSHSGVPAPGGVAEPLSQGFSVCGDVRLLGRVDKGNRLIFSELVSKANYTNKKTTFWFCHQRRGWF